MNNKPQKQNFRNVASRIVGYFANISKPVFFVKIMVKLYALYYKIDLNEFEVPQNYFKNFNEFFTRKYKENTRKIEEGLISPVDGYLLDKGKVNLGQIINVKNKDYFLVDLLGHKYKNLNSYAVLYLAPGNYHRVHAPFDMKITEIKYLPGTLRPVKINVINKKERVYCRNERVVIVGDSKYGKFYFILVGALFVGKVKLAFESGLRTNIRRGIASVKEYKESIKITKGEEVGYFEMGSSVVIVMENKCLDNLDLDKNHEIYFGTSLLNEKEITTCG